MTIQQFFDKYNNKGIDFDNYYGFQCMDLAHQYAVEVVGFDFAPAPAAKDVWNQNPKGYIKIKNTPDGVPVRGDIIIWGTAVGPFGHIAIFDHGDSNSFVSFDQNWPINSLCHFQNHNYTGVLGWLHPKSTPTTPQPSVPEQLSDDEKRALQVLKTAFSKATTKDSKPFGNLEGYANTLTQDCYPVWRNPQVTMSVSPPPLVGGTVTGVFTPATQGTITVSNNPIPSNPPSGGQTIADLLSAIFEWLQKKLGR